MSMRERTMRDERVLLVEDEEPIRDLVTTALRFTGFTVGTAATGPEGLALARNDAWHVLVLDVNLPGEASKRRSRAGRRVGAYPARSRSSTKPILSGGPRGGDDSRSVGGAGSAACRERAGRPCPGLGAAPDAAGAGGGLGGPGALAAGGELPSLWRGGEPPRRPQSPPGRNRLRSGGVVPPAATLCRVW